MTFSHQHLSKELGGGKPGASPRRLVYDTIDVVRTPVPLFSSSFQPFNNANNDGQPRQRLHAAHSSKPHAANSWAGGARICTH